MIYPLFFYKQFLRDALAGGVHNFGSDTFKWYLSAVTSIDLAHTQKSQISEIAAGNGYSAGGVAWSGIVVDISGMGAALKGNQPAITAAGGSIGPFSSMHLYNDTNASDKLVCSAMIDAVTARTLLTGQTFTLPIPSSGLLVNQPSYSSLPTYLTGLT